MSLLEKLQIIVRSGTRTVKDEPPTEVLIYPIINNPNRPEWFETYMVEDRESLEFLGFVGRLGMSRTWEWHDGYSDKGKGRSRSRDEAVLRLLKWAQR